ncbi:MAG: transglycosylase domain-containing protein [Christensenellales bacterium]|jgi:penicillin-binding protein 1A
MNSLWQRMRSALYTINQKSAALCIRFVEGSRQLWQKSTADRSGFSRRLRRKVRHLMGKRDVNPPAANKKYPSVLPMLDAMDVWPIEYPLPTGLSRDEASEDSPFLQEPLYRNPGVKAANPETQAAFPAEGVTEISEEGNNMPKNTDISDNPEPGDGTERKAAGFWSLNPAAYKRTDNRTPTETGGKQPGRNTQQEKERNKAPLPREPISLLEARKKDRSFFLQVILMTVALLALLVVIVGVGGIGVGLGIARAYVATTPELDVTRIEDQSETSLIYDKYGRLLTTYSGMENRIWASYDELPQNLLHAIVSVEDRRFYQHNGIDLKRIVGAFINNFTSGSTHGGSTITQQLIKMKLLTSEQTYKRKLQEAYLAMELEKRYTKEEILEAYLNTVYLGGVNYGVKTAAMDYFGKELSQLTLRECAMLAGLAQSPYTYNPRTNYYIKGTPELTSMRTNVVLKAMFENEAISLEEYEAALAEEVYILPESSNNRVTEMPYFIEYAMRNVIDHLLRYRGLEDNDTNRSLIERELRTSGYKITLTLDAEIQRAAEQAVYNYDSYPAMADSADATLTLQNKDGTSYTIDEPQASVTVVDYSTGQLTAMVGGRYSPYVMKAANRAWQTHMPVGSSIKPLAVYAPAIEKGLSPGSIIYNVPAAVTGWGTTRGYPNNYGGGSYTGPTTLRTGINRSLNIVSARLLMDYVGVKPSAEYLAAMGIDSDAVNADGPGLALGTSGISTLELATAYGTFPNMGVYKETVAFTTVYDATGNLVINSSQTQIIRTVFKKSTAWLMNDMLVDAVINGGGTRAKVEGITTAGKTGTNSDARGVTFAGYTPYFSCAVWIGHDNYKALYPGAQGGREAAPLFKAVMDAIHQLKGYTDKPINILDPSVLGLRKVTLCGVSGKIATELCEHDALGYGTHIDWVPPDFPMTDVCDYHVEAKYCAVSGYLAGAYCPKDMIEARGMVIVPEDSVVASFPESVLTQYLPGALVSMAPPDLTYDPTGALRETYAELVCPFHTKEWAENRDEWEDLKELALSLRLRVMNRAAQIEDLDAAAAQVLYDAVAVLDAALADETYNLETLQEAKNALETAYYNAPTRDELELDNTP